MKKYVYLSLLTFLCISSGCKKELATKNIDQANLETNVIHDFVGVVVYPNYSDIVTRVGELQQGLTTLTEQTDEENLAKARAAWRAARNTWEMGLCFAFGPMDDNNCETSADDWPVNQVDLNALLQSDQPLTLTYIQSLPASLRGFHTIEYLLFGETGAKTAAMFTAREMQYLSLIAEDLYNQASAIAVSWNPDESGSYGQQVLQSGTGSTRFSSRLELFGVILDELVSACDQVANEDMQTPLYLKDSALCKSAFSNNTLADFKSDIAGIQNVYLGAYEEKGEGLSKLVAAENPALDTKIQTAIQSALSSFDNITVSYEKAIYLQPGQIQEAQSQINALEKVFDTELRSFIENNIQD